MIAWFRGLHLACLPSDDEVLWPPRFDAKASAVVRLTSATTSVMIAALCVAAAFGGEARPGVWPFVLWACAVTALMSGVVWASSSILLAGRNAVRFAGFSDVVIAVGLISLDRPLMTLIGANLFVIVSTFSCLYLPTAKFAAHVVFTSSFVVVSVAIGEVSQPVPTALALMVTLWNVTVLPLVVRSLWNVTQVNAERAYHDPLTGLLNRSGLDREFRDMTLASSPMHRAAVMVVDLDRFKSINDHHGHLVGDGVIRAAAAHLRDHFGRLAAVARIGGEEFAVFLGGPPVVIEATVDAFRTSTVSGEVPAVTMSAGAAWCDVHSTERDPLTAALAAADRAMYDAKESGGDRCVSLLSSGPKKPLV